METTVDFLEEREGSWHASARVLCRVTLVNGQPSDAYREGTGCGEGRNRSKPASLHQATKSAETDAFKRACRLFGSVTGGCLWDQDYLRWVQHIKSSKRGWSRDDFYQAPSNRVEPVQALVDPYKQLKLLEKPLGKEKDNEVMDEDCEFGDDVDFGEFES